MATTVYEKLKQLRQHVTEHPVEYVVNGDTEEDQNTFILYNRKNEQFLQRIIEILDMRLQHNYLNHDSNEHDKQLCSAIDALLSELESEKVAKLSLVENDPRAFTFFEVGGWRLVHEENPSLTVGVGKVVSDRNGNRIAIKDASPPHKPESSGFIYTEDGNKFYPSVFGLKWVKK
jgi:hypothetical protein